MSAFCASCACETGDGPVLRGGWLYCSFACAREPGASHRAWRGARRPVLGAGSQTNLAPPREAPEQQELVDAEQAKEVALVVREGNSGGGRIDDLGPVHGVVGAAIGDHP